MSTGDYKPLPLSVWSDWYQDNPYNRAACLKELERQKNHLHLKNNTEEYLKCEPPDKPEEGSLMDAIKEAAEVTEQIDNLLANKIIELSQEGIETLFYSPSLSYGITVKLVRREENKNHRYSSKHIPEVDLTTSKLSKNELILQAIDCCEQRFEEEEERTTTEEKVKLTAKNYNEGFNKTYNNDKIEIIAKVAEHENAPILGKVKTCSYQISREPAPIYTVGSADPRNFARGKRNIAGTIIFEEVYHGNPPDQFNIIMEAINEYGNSSTMKIAGIELMLPEDSSKPNTIEPNKLYTFIATSISPWQAVPVTPAYEFYPYEKGDHIDSVNAGAIDLNAGGTTALYPAYNTEKEIATEEVDHTGETYNPYTGKWTFL